MQTNLLQSQLCRNAALITLLTMDMRDHKELLKELPAGREGVIRTIRKERAQIIKLALLQKAIKFDLSAMKLARLRDGGHRRKKHGKDDIRYEAWLVATGGISNT